MSFSAISRNVPESKLPALSVILQSHTLAINDLFESFMRFLNDGKLSSSVSATVLFLLTIHVWIDTEMEK